MLMRRGESGNTHRRRLVAVSARFLLIVAMRRSVGQKRPRVALALEIAQASIG